MLYFLIDAKYGTWESVSVRALLSPGLSLH